MSYQPASPNFAIYLLESLGYDLTEDDIAIFTGCRSAEEIMKRICNSHILNDLLIKDSLVSKGRLGEFYAALRLEARWEPGVGYDIYTAFKYLDRIKAGLIEVKTCGPTSYPQWAPRITTTSKKVIADVLIVCRLVSGYNPCDGVLFAIPKDALEPVAEKQLRMNPELDRPKIRINTRHYDSVTGRPCRWWEYVISDHAKLRERVSRYVHGDLSFLPSQPSLF